MKTTLEIPGGIFRCANAKAGERGIPLRLFVGEVVEEKRGRKSAGLKRAG